MKRIVYASSSSIYGDSEELPKREDMFIQPLSPYALSKYTAERYCQIYTKIYNFETVCLRYFNVFGPNQDPFSQYSAVIPKFIKLISENKQPTIYGDGTQSRDFTYVQNVVEANLLACTVPKAAGQVINIACHESTTLIELVEMIDEYLNKNIEPVFAKERSGDVKHSLASIEKAEDLLDYKVEVTFMDGLYKTINFLLNNKKKNAEPRNTSLHYVTPRQARNTQN